MDEMDMTPALPNPHPWVPHLPHDFSRFDLLMSVLQGWATAQVRSDAHEDNLVICRSDVISIIEGVKALRPVT